MVKCHSCIPKKTGCKYRGIGIYHFCPRFIPQFLRVCYVFAESKFVQIHFFVPVLNGNSPNVSRFACFYTVCIPLNRKGQQYCLLWNVSRQWVQVKKSSYFFIWWRWFCNICKHDTCHGYKLPPTRFILREKRAREGRERRCLARICNVWLVIRTHEQINKGT